MRTATSQTKSSQMDFKDGVMICDHGVEDFEPSDFVPAAEENEPSVVDFRADGLEEHDNAKFSTKLYAYVLKHGMPRDAFDGLIKLLNKYISKIAPSAPALLSHYSSRRRHMDGYPVARRKYDACPMGCKPHTDDDPSDRCTMCCSTNGNGNSSEIESQRCQ